MQIDKRKQLILKAIPERKKTSKKLKQKVLEQIYFRSSSLPQKKYTQPKEKEISFSRRHIDLRNQSSEPPNKQRFLNRVQPSFDKIDQEEQFIHHKPIQRKNRSLPKYLCSEAKSSHNDSQFQLESFKNTDQYRTKAKKLSQKEQKEMLHQSQEKHRLQTLQQILKKKNSQRLIRENILSTNMRHSPMQNSLNQKVKNKESKMIGLKYAFENRKFTNLSKYKSSMGARQNPFGSGKSQFNRQQNNSLSRKVSKQNSKTRIKTSEHENVCEQDDGIDGNVNKKNSEVQIKDLDLTQYIDGENVNKKDHGNKVVTLQDVFYEAYELYLTVVGTKDKQKVENKEIKQSKSINLERSLKLLKAIEKQTGSLSRKTVLLLGLVCYHSHQYNNCIFYIENVFRQVNYNLYLIDSIKKWINSQDIVQFYSHFFIVLADSYKHTQNFLCSIKVLDQWEKHIVRKTLKQHQYKSTFQPEQKKNRTISHLNNYETYKNQRKLTRNDNSKRQNQSFASVQQLNPKKKSYSFLRQNSQGKMGKGYFSTTVKQKQRTQSLVNKQSVKCQTQLLNARPRAKHLSIKTLSDINLNFNQQANQQIVEQEQLRNLHEKQGQIFAVGYLMRARIQFEVKNFYASIKDYERTLICSPDKLEPGLQLATIFYKIGRKDKCIEFLQNFLQQFLSERQLQTKNQESIKQIKYHLAVMLYKSAKYQESLKVLESIQKEDKQGIEGQICFYKALNLIKLKRVFCMLKQYKKQQTNKKSDQQHQKGKCVEEILIMLQQSIDLGCSQFYIYAGYFLRIYLLLFKVRHYYGAQYEIDRMKETIESKKYGLLVENGDKREKMQYGRISIEPFNNIVSLQDLVQLTSGIICILKLKLGKGLQLIAEIQEKVKTSKRMMESANIISIETIDLNDWSQEEHIFLINQMFKLMSEFKYYALFTMRQYQPAIRCLEKIRLIDGANQASIQGQGQQRLRVKEQSPLSEQEDESMTAYEMFISESDKLNYLNLQALILIEQKKFHEALKMLKLVEHESQPEDKKRHKRTKSGNLETISTVIEYKKDENMFHIIKALCYILLYQYLEDQKPIVSSSSHKNSSKSVKKRQKSKDSIEVTKTINNRQPHLKQSYQSSVQQDNNQILLVAEDLLSQCLVCDKENFEILYLIAVIHYELERYESALNYIRQAIELSDDHMIKHYYLKANMKLLLGKYEEAVKDYSNAITVHKEFEKQKKDQHENTSITTHNQQQSSRLSSDSLNQRPSSFQHQFHPDSDESSALTSRTCQSKHDLNEYYEEEQQMHMEIYLNRAIAYLKYAYNIQFDTCRTLKFRAQEDTFLKYGDVRENITNLKSTAAQDVVNFFKSTLNQMKIQYQAIIRKCKKTPSQQNHLKSHSQSKSNPQKSPSPSKPSDLTPQQTFKLKPFIEKAMKISPFIQLLLHTSQVEPMLQISRTFAKDFNIKLISDEELLIYFYIAKQLNNCLLLMEKIIKKHYLSQKNIKQTKNTTNNKPSQLRKPTTSKYETQQCEPYFKSKKDNKGSSKTYNYPEFNAQKYTPKNTHFQHKRSNSSELSSPQKSQQENQKILKLIFDKKVLSALKDSSNNSKEDYENALVTLLEEQQAIRKNANRADYSLEGGSIFTYSDLVFFIGVLYYLLEDFQNAIRYFVSSYNIKKNQNQLYTLKSIVSPSPVSFSQSCSQEGKWYHEKRQMQNLKNYEEIYDNRIYSKEEIQYNIGLAYLMAKDYNSAYDQLEKYEQFVEIIETALTHNEGNLDDKKTKNKLKKIINNLQQSEPEDDPDLSLDQVSVKTKTNKSEDNSDITPFPTHNRLCSIYPQKSIHGKSFHLSFCLPKIQLPLVGIFSQDQIEIANVYRSRIQDKSPCQNQSFVIDNTRQLFINPKLKKQNSTKSFIQKNDILSLPKQSIFNFLDIVSLKDIEMKPIAPWIKKDKQKRCIRFTDNFLAESYDLKTQTTTERKHRNSSKKDMFAESSSKAFQKRPTLRQQGTSQRKQCLQLVEKPQIQRANGGKLIKKPKADEYNFLKQKQKQKTGQNRYETIEHD